VDDGRSMISPCPNRDHHDELERLLMQYEPEPTDSNAADTLIDPEYTAGLAAYNRRFETITDPIWKSRYLDRKACDGVIAPLPDVPHIPVAEEAEMSTASELDGAADGMEREETASVSV